MDGVSKRMFKCLLLKLPHEKIVNMLKNTEIAETIYEVIVEHYYQKKATRADSNQAVIGSKMS